MSKHFNYKFITRVANILKNNIKISHKCLNKSLNKSFTHKVQNLKWRVYSYNTVLR